MPLPGGELAGQPYPFFQVGEQFVGHPDAVWKSWRNLAGRAAGSSWQLCAGLLATDRPGPDLVELAVPAQR